MNLFGRHAAAAIGVAALLAGCASKPKPVEPTRVDAVIQVSAQANPSTSHRPSPVLVRIYELKATGAFDSADFISLYQREQATLAADLVAKDEFMLTPGESKPFVKTLAPETRFLGVTAAFRDVEHAKWRSTFAVAPAQNARVVIRVGELSIEALANR